MTNPGKVVVQYSELASSIARSDLGANSLSIIMAASVLSFKNDLVIDFLMIMILPPLLDVEEFHSLSSCYHEIFPPAAGPTRAR